MTETQSNAEFSLTYSRGLIAWMQEHQLSLGLSTYQAGKMFFVGTQPNGRLSTFERTFPRCMGMWTDGNTVWMSSLYQIWRFENFLAPGQTTSEGYDRVFVPVVGHTTGEIDTHDVSCNRDGQLTFVNTLFNCVCTLSETKSFKPVWRPPYISEYAPEDRCHLNGLATDPQSGEPRYITSVSRSDILDGWRDKRANGGVVVDIQEDQVVCEGLSMPHSPRLHPDMNDRIWLLNSGTGDFGYADLNTGNFQPVAFCPGYMRGLALVGNYAVIGLSACRENRTFTGLALQDRLKEKDTEPRCGVQVINLSTGRVEHWMRIEGVVRELYDVVVMPGVRRPMMLGFKTDEIKRMLAIDLD